MGKNDKGTNLYNVRLRKRNEPLREGSLQPSVLDGLDVKFVILYRLGDEAKNDYRVFHVHHHATMSEERMRQAWYPNPQGSYFCYVFDEEVQLSSPVNISEIIKQSTMPQGAPIFLTGEEMMEYVSK